MPVANVSSQALLHALHKMEKRGVIESAHRALQICGEVFRYAIATQRAQADLSLILKGALTPVKETHHASITDPNKIGDLLRTLYGYQGSYLTQQALKLGPLVFVRPGELRHAEWTEFDLDNGEWRLPAHKMKMKAVHIVPLSKQAVEILEQLRQHTGRRQICVPRAAQC